MRFCKQIAARKSNKPCRAKIYSILNFIAYPQAYSLILRAFSTQYANNV